MGDTGQPPRLDEAALERVRRAAEQGLSDREIFGFVGVSERTWYSWKERARKAAAVLPHQWRSLRYDELASCCEELGVNMASVRRSGARGRHTREDLVRALADQAERYRALLDTLDRARPSAKLTILEQLNTLMEGRARIRRTRTTQRVTYRDEGGRKVPVPAGDAIITTEEVELPPDRQALLKMLEMRWPEEYGGRRQPGLPGAGGEQPDAGAAARQVTSAVHRMLSTVTPPPEAEAERR